MRVKNLRQPGVTIAMRLSCTGTWGLAETGRAVMHRRRPFSAKRARPRPVNMKFTRVAINRPGAVHGLAQVALRVVNICNPTPLYAAHTVQSPRGRALWSSRGRAPTQ